MKDFIVYCDICGQRYKASQTTKLSTYTGRGDLIVCFKDADKIDYGLVPYRRRSESSVPYVRAVNSDTTISAPFMDLESMTYTYWLVASQDNSVLQPSQDDSVGFSV